MAIIGDIIQRIKNKPFVGVPPDDFRLSDRNIYQSMRSIRSALLEQKIKKKQKLSPWVYQTLPEIEMVRVSKHECGFRVPEGCKVLRSKYKIPKPISSFSKSEIRNVSTLDKKIYYSFVEESSLRYVAGNKYSKNPKSVYIVDGYLYSLQAHGDKILTLEGVFEDPLEASQFHRYCKKCPKDCSSFMERDFYFEEVLIVPLIEMVFQDISNQARRPEQQTQQPQQTQVPQTQEEEIEE